VTIKKIRSGLVVVILLALTAQVVWWTLSPLIPLLIIAICLITIIGSIYYRRRI
jgi:hypothetical protein